ncbi:MAG: beta-lactam-binding protein with PASTA domain/predicted Ser/Thr protein kinase [Paracrocinitomix sp.]|jgi:beta-lactam-binding protein with PASTA domain/predicted Ser/Thr protein kinase
MSEESPTVFGGRYELHRRLARGGMADVFLARDQLLGRPVAVKVLFPEYATDPKFVERFRREAQAAANLNHPNIVSIYDWGEELGTYYIVMEYVEGQSLAQILRRDGSLTVEQVTRVALDVAGALGFAHEGGVVHRDVKPGNVLVSPKGEMKVADFGIATAMTANADANLTQTGAVMGTATYFSPEQAQGHKVDHRSDLYSLGVLLYEMLVGQPPFTGETPVSIAYKHVQEPVVPVTDHGVEIPPALAAITMKLLSKNPDNRYPSAGALVADLDRFRQGQAIAAAAAMPHVQGQVPGALMGAGGAAIGATTAVPSQPSQSQPLPVTYREPPRRRGGLMVAGVLLAGLLLAGFLILLQEVNNNATEGDGLPTATAAQTVVVPSVGGRVESDARSTLEGLQLVVETVATADNSIPVGQVIRTDPPANSVVNLGSTVTIFVSSGANVRSVPSVLTMTENEALQAISRAGFEPSRQAVTSDLAPEGEVVGQEPSPGSLADPGSVVVYQVSIGTEELPIPDVRGEEPVAARELLEAEGFIVLDQFELEFDDEIERDLVLGTIPAAGEAAKPGSEVAIVLSEGPEDLILPSFIGFDKGQVFIEIDGLGLVAVELGQFVTDPTLVGKVVDTNPGPNSVVVPGQQIQVFTGLLSPEAGNGSDPGSGNGDFGQGQGQGQDDDFDG